MCLHSVFMIDHSRKVIAMRNIFKVRTIVTFTTELELDTSSTHVTSDFVAACERATSNLIGCVNEETIKCIKHFNIHLTQTELDVINSIRLQEMKLAREERLTSNMNCQGRLGVDEELEYRDPEGWYYDDPREFTATLVNSLTPCKAVWSR
jgi:hypothetical protein